MPAVLARTWQATPAAGPAPSRVQAADLAAAASVQRPRREPAREDARRALSAGQTRMPAVLARTWQATPAAGPAPSRVQAADLAAAADRAAPRAAAAGACQGGCEEGLVCRPDKDAGCAREDLASDASCWTCAEQSAGRGPGGSRGQGSSKGGRGERAEAPEGACQGGCEEGLVCRPDKEAGCAREDLASDASCWTCAEQSAGRGPGGSRGQGSSKGG